MASLKKKIERQNEEGKMQKALQEIRNGTSIRKASAKFGIPKSTLQFRIHSQCTSYSKGPPSFLKEHEEGLLVQWLVKCARKGFPRRCLDLTTSVQQYLKQNPRSTPFKNDKPGRKWLRCFLNRHPEVDEVPKANTCVTKNDLIKWFNSIETFLKDEGSFEILKDPSRVFNVDETGFQLCPKTGKVPVRKGDGMYEVESGPTKTCITAVCSFSASGEVVPPMIVYPYRRIPKEVASSIPDGWGIGKSDSGCTNSAVFYEYVANTFAKYLEVHDVQKPVILFADGHKDHITFQLSELCNKLQIILVCLYPIAARILQPADVTAFKPLKEMWKCAVAQWKNHNTDGMINKEEFAPILQTAFVQWMSRPTPTNGFRAFGLFPWGHHHIDFPKYSGAETKNPSAESMEESSEIFT